MLEGNLLGFCNQQSGKVTFRLVLLYVKGTAGLVKQMWCMFTARYDLSVTSHQRFVVNFIEMVQLSE